MSGMTRSPQARGRALPIQSSSTFPTTRFVTPGQQQRSTRTAAQLTVAPGHQFSTLNASAISFSITTVDTMQSDYLQPSKRKAKSTSDESEKQVAAPEEPPTKRRRPSKPKSDEERKPRLVFSTAHPIQAETNLDVWRVILNNSPPALLLQVKTVSKKFNELMQENAIWKNSREKLYGEGMPGPPGEMTERKYGDLIAGRGCHSRDCPRSKTDKVFWAFQVRLCDECVHLFTIRGDTVGRRGFVHVQQHNLLDLLPAGTITNGKYRGSRSLIADTKVWSVPSNRAMFFTPQVKAIDHEYGQLEVAGKTPEEIDKWRQDKLEALEPLIQQVSNIEKWEKERNTATVRYREERKVVFGDHAQKLSPPMSAPVLLKMWSYHKSLESNRPPTERAWDMLKAKIMPFRQRAEEIVDWDLSKDEVGSASQKETQLSTNLMYRRRNMHQDVSGYADEQRFVLTLARTEFQSCKNMAVADPDLALMCFRRVFEAYYQLPENKRPLGMNADGKAGTYALILDDLRLIVSEVIEPEVKHDPGRKHVVLESFKCKGCTRPDCMKKYGLTDALDHIVRKHACLVGDETKFDYFARPVSNNSRTYFYTVVWPRNLPLAAAHHDLASDYVWTPDASVPYQQLKGPGGISAFHGRAARNVGIPGSDFAETFAFAVGKTMKTDLDARGQTKIALHFAVDRFRDTSAQPLLLDLLNQSINFIQSKDLKLDLRYRCGLCVAKGLRPRGAKFVRNPVGVHDLQEHWKEKHEDEDWTEGLMDLPNDHELYDHMMETDRLLKEKKENVLKEEAAKKKVASKKPNAKASVVLGKDLAMDVFDQLFPKV